jgi:hypothetical protein
MSRHLGPGIVGGITIALTLGIAGATAQAQSLGEVARQEAARRQAVKGPVKVITNENLKPLPGEQSVTVPAASKAEPGQPTAEGEAAVPAAQDAAAPAADQAATRTVDPRTTEEFWRKRMADARAVVERNALLMDALQSRINALLTDFTARDDPAQRAVIATERQRALDELDRMTRDQKAATKAVADVEEEARRAGIPAGWVR